MRIVAYGLLLGALLVPTSAGAQGAPVPPPMTGGGQGTAGQGQAQGQPEKPEPKPPANPTAGYAYSDKAPAARSGGGGHRRIAHKAGAPTVNLPGFEQLPDGGSRLFVQLSSQVPVEERHGKGSLTYVLKGASARVWNNTNALVTVHFNTPVTRARLEPHGNDLHFVVDLRAPATPTYKVTEGQDKTAMLTIDFPKGDYLGGAPAAANGEGEAGEHPAPAAGKGRGGRSKKPAGKTGAAPSGGASTAPPAASGPKP